MSRPRELAASTLSASSVFVLVTLRYFLMFFNILLLVLLLLASIMLIAFLIWINF